MSSTNPRPSHSDAIVNPNGPYLSAYSLVFLGSILITSLLTRENGIFQTLPTKILHLTVPGASKLGNERVIPALAALYIFFTYAGTGAVSAAAVAASRREGYDNNHPREHINNLKGLPLRMRSAHNHLMEMFPGFALSAALTQTLAPGNQQLINLLGLHVFAKVGVYYPAYLCNMAPLRNLMHLIATSSVINVACQLATGAR